ncbi:MAG: NUDIX domain-containing protein, partial [Nitrospirae bacterium]|nr:NUDIX domain-containing protein [Nitrospirota bacterium]
MAPRRACHGNPRHIHRAAHVLVFNSSGQLLLQKRSQAKDIKPGKWDTSELKGHRMIIWKLLTIQFTLMMSAFRHRS